MDLWNLYVKTSNHISRVKFWHLQDTKKIDTYKDQHSHSPSSDWHSQTGHFIPLLIELKRESSVFWVPNMNMSLPPAKLIHTWVQTSAFG